MTSISPCYKKVPVYLVRAQTAPSLLGAVSHKTFYLSSEIFERKSLLLIHAFAHAESQPAHDIDIKADTHVE